MPFALCISLQVFFTSKYWLAKKLQKYFVFINFTIYSNYLPYLRHIEIVVTARYAVNIKRQFQLIRNKKADWRNQISKIRLNWNKK